MKQLKISGKRSKILSQRSDNDNYRNGYKTRQVNSSYGSMEIEIPQDRKSAFEPQVVKKRQKDISDIDQTGGNFRLLLTCTSMCCYK